MFPDSPPTFIILLAPYTEQLSLNSLVVMTPAYHRGGRGSPPGMGNFDFFIFFSMKDDDCIVFIHSRRYQISSIGA